MTPDIHEWEENDTPAVNVQATKTRPAPGQAGLRHVCTGVAVTIVNAGGSVSGVVTVVLRDGAAAVGRIMQAWKFIVPAGDTRGVVDLRRFIGSENREMTIETTAAPGADVTAVVNMSGLTEQIPS